MISSSTLPLIPYECPACRCKIPQFKALFFQGIHVLAEIECGCCDEIYFQTLPTGHAAHFSVAFCKNKPEKSRYNLETAEWLALPLIESIPSLSHKNATIRRNPKTGDPVSVPAKVSFGFVASPILKKRINANYEAK